MRQFSLSAEVAARGLAESLPAPFDKARAEAGLLSLAENAKSEPDRRLLSAVFGNSPFLGACLLRDPEFAGELLTTPPDAVLESVLAELKAADAGTEDTGQLMARLRAAKTRVSLVTALADITGLWPLEKVTGALSAFAGLCLTVTCDHLLGRAAEAGDLDIAEAGSWSEGSGYAVIAMGKLGGGELNYSSDIDLIVLYDEDIAAYTGRRSLQDCMVRMTGDLIRVMQERTADGYVFRTDLRLRPDPGATPLAISLGAAESYYESIGKNWERAAMIKARPVAGDLEVGADFLTRIAPFVWRRHLDFAAMQDIREIKDQIHVHHGHKPDTVPGLDIKLGHGGIREIEFFAQAHQLVAGGRDRDLRGNVTCEVLGRLAETGTITGETAADLIAAYRFLRQLEHRLQMINDEQTHAVPETRQGREHIACFMGFATTEAFETTLGRHLDIVRGHFQRLFEDWDSPEGALAAREAPAIMAPGAAPADSVEALAAMGYVQAERALEIAGAWPLGRYHATRHERAGAIIRKLTPAILVALSGPSDPDATLRRFDEFLAKLPAGVQFLSLLQANPWLLDLLAEIMGYAPRLAETLGRNVALLDSVLSREFYEAVPDKAALMNDLGARLEASAVFQDILDESRRWANERKFQVGLLVLRGRADARAAGLAQSEIADALITLLWSAVEREFISRHGHLGEGFAVVALGKLGGRELTLSSDLDLLFIYEVGAMDETSDGRDPLAASTYFGRLSQRMINALTAMTAEGRLYEVDMRLRPSGRAGPIAVSLEAFEKYHRESAWTWERMALTRARVAVGPEALAGRVNRAIAEVLTRPPESGGKLVLDVAEMRDRLRKEFGPDNPWNVKHAPGGLLDVEFIAQYLQLRHGHENAEILSANTGDAIGNLALAGYLSADESAALAGAHRFQSDVQSTLRLCADDGFHEDQALPGLHAILARTVGADSFDDLKSRLKEAQKQVAKIYRKLIEKPAAAARAATNNEDESR